MRARWSGVSDSLHLAHDASVEPLWCTAGGRFEASAAAAPEPLHLMLLDHTDDNVSAASIDKWEGDTSH